MLICHQIACTIGASIIYVDVLILLFKKDAKFRIEKSTGFLSSSLSLSSGVMVQLFSRNNSDCRLTKVVILGVIKLVTYVQGIPANRRFLAAGGFVDFNMLLHFRRNWNPGLFENITSLHTVSCGRLRPCSC